MFGAGLVGGLLGQRRSWMLLAQGGIVSGLLMLSQLDPSADIGRVAFMALVIAFSSATQDITIDAYRIEAVSERGYSRIPIWSAANQMVTGVLHAKDLLVYRWRDPSSREPLESPEAPQSPESPETPKSPATVKHLAHRTIFTTPETPLTQLLDIFKRSRKHFSIVIEPATGSILGICTLEDVLEVLFGPIEEDSSERGSPREDEPQHVTNEA